MQTMRRAAEETGTAAGGGAAAPAETPSEVPDLSWVLRLNTLAATTTDAALLGREALEVIGPALAARIALWYADPVERDGWLAGVGRAVEPEAAAPPLHLLASRGLGS